MKTGLVIAAGGIGKRLKSSTKKQFLELSGKPVLWWTLKPFLETRKFNSIVVVVPEDEKNSAKSIFSGNSIIKVVSGGKERYHSVYNGLISLPDDTEYVLIHDGVRPFIKKSIIVKMINSLKTNDALTAGIPVKDTIVTAGESLIDEYADRDKMWLIQTPQAFKYSLILDAYEFAFKTGVFGTDDTSLVKNIGQKVRLITSDYLNIKITSPEDFEHAKLIIKDFKY